MSLRSVLMASKPTLGSTTVKIQTLRFGTFSLANVNSSSMNDTATLANDSVSRQTFQIPTWLEAILWAAPKKKTSHSKKRMRASNKGLQQKENVTTCPACGSNKLLHHLCKNCYDDIKKNAKFGPAMDA